MLKKNQGKKLVQQTIKVLSPFRFQHTQSDMYTWYKWHLWMKLANTKHQKSGSHFAFNNSVAMRGPRNKILKEKLA